MRNEREGAKEARREIKSFQEHINSPRLCPDQCYRMASPTYALVCYVNQVTGLFLSKNYYVIPIFLQRAYAALQEVDAERVSVPYRRLVEQYLSHVAHFIVNYPCLAEDERQAAQYIPPALLASVPVSLPQDLLMPDEF
ncbi:hypothetical protein [Janthinobacterium sp. RT4P48]|uniref:hypothetical protein n=1 Tax=Janthinobacterium sp. RT4P48 TaxID=3424188 RepID=UPI003F29B140